MGLIHEIKNAKKSRDTAILLRIILILGKSMCWYRLINGGWRMKVWQKEYLAGHYQRAALILLESQVWLKDTGRKPW